MVLLYGQKKCACGSGSHSKVGDTCDFYLYSQLGRPTFNTLELKSRLRRHNELYPYKKCIYESSTNNISSQLVSFADDRDEELDPKSNDDANDDLIGLDKEEEDEDETLGSEREINDLSLTPEARMMIDDDDDSNEQDDTGIYDVDLILMRLEQQMQSISQCLEIFSTSWTGPSYPCIMSTRPCTSVPYVLQCSS